MAKAKFIHEGNSIDYAPESSVGAGDIVVQGELVCVAKRDIAAGELGSLATVGVYDFPKASGVSTAIAVGADLYWDIADQQATTDDDSGTNKHIGKSVAAATDDDVVVRVRLSQ